MISLFLVSTIACYTNFDELANALTDGKYYAISYTTGAAAAWAATEIAATDITTATKRSYCTDPDTCADFSGSFPDRLKYPYTFGTASKCKDKSAAEIAAAYLYGLHTAEQPSLYYIAGCAENGKDFETTTTTHTAAKCGTEITHPLSALQGIVDKYPLKEVGCYPIPAEATAEPTCAKPSGTTCTDDSVYAKYKAVFKLGYANKISLDKVKEHIQKYGPIIMKLYLNDAADLKPETTKFEKGDGIYCAKTEAGPAVKYEWVEVVGYGSDQKALTADTAYCEVTQTEAQGALPMPFLVARSQYDVTYFTGKDKTFFKVPLGFASGTLTLKDPLKDSTTGTATYSGFFLYTSKFEYPTGTVKKIATYDSTTKIVKFDEFKEADYLKLKAGKESDPAFSLWTDADIKANAQASQLHKDTSNKVASTKFFIDALYLTAKLHGETLTGVASVAGTVGTATAIGFGDNVNFMEADPTTKKYDGSSIDNVFTAGIAEQGLVLASCLPEIATDIYTSDTKKCTSTGEPDIARVATGLKSLLISGPTEADLKKAIAYYGPVMAIFTINPDELTTHLNARTTETVNNPYVITATEQIMYVLVVGWGEYTPAGSNAAHTKWYVKVNSPGCTKCGTTGENQFGTFTYITGATATPVPVGGMVAFVKAGKADPGKDAALSFLPPLKPLVFIASLLFLLL